MNNGNLLTKCHIICDLLGEGTIIMDDSSIHNHTLKIDKVIRGHNAMLWKVLLSPPRVALFAFKERI